VLGVRHLVVARASLGVHALPGGEADARRKFQELMVNAVLTRRCDPQGHRAALARTHGHIPLRASSRSMARAPSNCSRGPLAGWKKRTVGTTPTLYSSHVRWSICR